MAAGAEIERWSGPSRRRMPRFRILVPLDVTVLRSGVPETLPGRALNVCERGIGAILAGELKIGESVGIELQLEDSGEPLRTRATVRYQDKLRHGLEFTAISAAHRNAIRNWAKGVKAEPEIRDPKSRSRSLNQQAGTERGRQAFAGYGGGGPRDSKPKRLWSGWLFLGLLTLAVAGTLWWQWNRSWQELEAGLKGSPVTTLEKPQAQVSAEVMQKLLIHRVEPVYPPEARKERLQGMIALQVVVGRDGSISSMRALNGPDILAQAAMDALRWWKFEPYRINGEPAPVETTLAIEFKR
jgi:TonB family protein